MNIKTPSELQIAIDNPTDEAIIAIATYKWYNFYCNLHIKEGSKEDLENQKIFDNLRRENNILYTKIEEQVDVLIERLQND